MSAWPSGIAAVGVLVRGHANLASGFTVAGATPAHLSSGIARIDAHGHATWTTAAAAGGNRTVTGVAINCALALSPARTTVYVTVTSPTRGILAGLDARPNINTQCQCFAAQTMTVGTHRVNRVCRNPPGGVARGAVPAGLVTQIGIETLSGMWY